MRPITSKTDQIQRRIERCVNEIHDWVNDHTNEDGTVTKMVWSEVEAMVGDCAWAAISLSKREDL